MSKKNKKIDLQTIDLPFGELSRRADDLLAQKQELDLAIHNRRYRQPSHQEYFDEDCVEIASAVKTTIRKTGMSRPQMVDAINVHYGWPTTKEVAEMETCPKDHLSLHMFNHYLSKPTEYRMPAGLLFAIVRIAKDLEPARVIACAAGGDVVEDDEKEALLAGKSKKLGIELGKLQKSIEANWR